MIFPVRGGTGRRAAAGIIAHGQEHPDLHRADQDGHRDRGQQVVTIMNQQQAAVSRPGIPGPGNILSWAPGSSCPPP